MKYTATARAWPRRPARGDSAVGGVQDAQVEGESVLGLDGHDDLQALNPVTIIRYVS